MKLSTNMRHTHETAPQKSGVAALVFVVVIGITAVALVIAIVYTLTKTIAQEQSGARGQEALGVAEGGAEEVALRIRKGETVSSPLTITIGSGTATVTNIVNGSVTTITSTGTVNGAKRAVEVKIQKNTTDISFFYGVQVGDGGLVMGQNSRVNGNIYSDGDIVGANKATITGDAFVAIASQLIDPDTSWEVKNANFDVGKTVGAAATAVDTGGDVGQYTSVAIASDGFGRISYYDATNKDLKFVQCTNASCSTKNTSSVDTGGDVGQYTSLKLGSDDFARISYYDNTNGDLKFVQCTNASCSTKVVTAVDTTNDMGKYTALVLDSSNFARISYYDNKNNDLKFAQCTNADCTTKNITSVDTANDVGRYTSIVLGSDGFARMSYVYTKDSDLKFVQCTNASCSTKNITTVDSAPSIDNETAIALGQDGFARISYYDAGNNDLKFAQCTNADCTTKNITSIDTGGNVGQYSALVVASDGFGRISYYDATNKDLKFVQCTNASCSTKNTSSVDTGGDVGQYTSLVLGSDGFGRISEYDFTNKDLKFIQCDDARCSGPDDHVDVAQSFQPTVTEKIVRAELYLKKVGVPADATLRLIRDKNGVPSTQANDVLATGTITASQVTASYGWLSVSFSTNPTLTAGTPYWLVIDTTLDNTNYYVWGGDATDAYISGTGEETADWTAGGWAVLGGDLDFRTFRKSVDHQIKDVTVGNDVKAHIMSGDAIGRDAYGYTFDNGTVGRDIFADAISNCTITRNASYNTKQTCTIGGTSTTPATPPDDPGHVDLPISDATIQDWKDGAAAGGTCGPPTCDDAGNYELDSNKGKPSGSLGPMKVLGNLTVTNNATLTVTGTIWVVGTITFTNNCVVKLDASYGSNSGVVLTDSLGTVNPGCAFQGSGNPNSFPMLLSAKDDPPNTVLAVDNNSAGVIYYASKGRIHFKNNAAAQEATGYGIDLDNDATITYNSGLANAHFSSGPGGGYTTISWKEIVPP